MPSLLKLLRRELAALPYLDVRFLQGECHRVAIDSPALGELVGRSASRVPSSDLGGLGMGEPALRLLKGVPRLFVSGWNRAAEYP